MGLIDAGFIGLAFTWSHGRNVTTRRFARFDRALCDDEWRRALLESTLSHLPHSHSNHCPIMLQTVLNASNGLGMRTFRFLVTWLEHKDFTRVLNENWSPDSILPASLQTLSEALLDWNTNVFGNIIARKKRLLR